MNAQVDKWLDENKENILSSIQEVIRIRSVKEPPAGDNAPFGQGIRDCLDKTMEIFDRMGFPAKELDGKVCWCDYGEGEELLGIMAHLDVVPEGTGWLHDPYGAEVVDGNIFGRGTLDDKGPGICALWGLAAVKAMGLPMKRRVRVIFGCDEESGMSCMEHYLKTEEVPTLAFSPDADYPLVNSEKASCKSVYAKKYASGIRMTAGERINVVPCRCDSFVPVDIDTVSATADKLFADTEFTYELTAENGGTSIILNGVAAHASLPDQGHNALQATVMLLNALPLTGEDAITVKGIYDTLKMDVHGETIGLDQTDYSGRLTLNLAIIRWDENGISDMKIDIRKPISMDRDYTRKQLADGFARGGIAMTEFACGTGHYIAPDSELVKNLLDVYATRAGEYLPPLAIGGGTYARCFPNAVAFGVERPGISGPIHMPNEYMSVDDMMFNVKMMADAIIALACK